MGKNKKPYWELNVSPFTFLDRVKIFIWLCREKIWTQGEWVKKYEKRWSDYTKCPHVIAVSSGSTANELIALKRKSELEEKGIWNNRKKVLFAANTWISNISPWVNFGFDPVFIDPSLRNLCVSAQDINIALQKDHNIGTVFYTSLLGYSESIASLLEVCERNNVKLMMDNCESSFSRQQRYYNSVGYVTNINNFVTSSTSAYFSHFTTSGTEMGLIFCQDQDEADWYKMARNHGMTRGMPDKYKNPNVNSDFDFYLMGSNYRTSNLQAYMALLDFDRALKFSLEQRIRISDAFYSSLDFDKFETGVQFESVTDNGSHMIPLALPIVIKEKANRPDLINKVKGYLAAKNVQTRPVIAGWLGAHTAFKKYNLDPKQFPKSVWLNENSIYLGLHAGVTTEMARDIARGISKL